VIITMPLLLAGLQIGGGLASKLLEKDNPKLARNISTLIGGFTAGAQGMTDLAGAFAPASIGRIGKGIASETDSLTDIFTSPYSSGGLANTLKIGGDPTQPGLFPFKPLGPLSGIGSGWGM